MYSFANIMNDGDEYGGDNDGQNKYSGFGAQTDLEGGAGSI
jgi:hypothetical protein